MKIFNDEILDFRTALYQAECKECCCALDWEANFDADGTNYNATCCGLRYSLSPYKVVVGIETED